MQAEPASPGLSDERIDRWLRALVKTPGLTSIRSLTEARSVHVDGVLHASEWLAAGSLVDVGSGGGSPGLPLAAARPDLTVTLLDSAARKTAFLERWAREFANVSVHRARAEEAGAGELRGAHDGAVTRALAQPAVALEWTLPLVRLGGRALLFSTVREEGTIAEVAPLLGGTLAGVVRAEEGERALFVVDKTGATPPKLPRPGGLARKRPLGRHASQ
jgi:16S rRNA (guanine527-N7)-methyltransferase